MNAKKQRLLVIENLLRTEIIRSQTELQQYLIDRGFDVTQATLSRDVRLLKIIKILDNEGHYRYTLPDSDIKVSRLPSSLLKDVTIEFSDNLAVVKTHPGYAMGLASYIDEKAPKEILATIAGDDTILVIPREGYNRIQVQDAIKRVIKC